MLTLPAIFKDRFFFVSFPGNIVEFNLNDTYFVSFKPCCTTLIRRKNKVDNVKLSDISFKLAY